MLEFLWALARNPRLWQGREKLTPKHQEPVDVLALTEEQVQASRLRFPINNFCCTLFFYYCFLFLVNMRYSVCRFGS